jgi:hypothetical protein
MGKSQVLNRAVEIALKSRVDDVFLVTPQGTIKLEKGKYGGWLLRPPLEGLDVAYGLWCYGVEERDADEQVLDATKDIQEKVAKVASTLGVNKMPLVSPVSKRFRTVKAVKKKATDRYSVYEIDSVDREAVATLAYVHYRVWWSRRGKCHGELCGVLDKFSKLLKAEFKEGVEVGDAGVYVPYDVSAITAVVERFAATNEEEVAAETKEGGKAINADVRDGVTYLIAVKATQDIDIEAVVKAIREKLKEMDVEAVITATKVDL